MSTDSMSTGESIGPKQWLPVDALLDALLLGPDEALSAALTDSAAAGLPAIEVSAQSARDRKSVV